MKTEHKIYLGKCDYNQRGQANCKAFITWELKEGEKGLEFSAQAEIWNPRETDIYCGGQCLDTVAAFFKGNKKAARIVEIWNQYHLNGMKAGLPAQEKAIAEWTAQGNRYEYGAACDMLKAKGLYEIALPEGSKCTGSFPTEVLNGTRGYRYGERWVFSAIPADIVAEIRSWSELVNA